jgi:hypothetical protein
MRPEIRSDFYWRDRVVTTDGWRTGKTRRRPEQIETLRRRAGQLLAAGWKKKDVAAHLDVTVRYLQKIGV